MAAEINELFNVISRRNVFTHITLNRHLLRPAVLLNHSIYAGLSTKLNKQALPHVIVLIDPYFDQWNAEDPRIIKLMDQLQGNIDEPSAVKEILIMKINRPDSRLYAFDMSNFFIPSSDNAQCNLIGQCLNQFHPTLCHPRNGPAVN